MPIDSKTTHYMSYTNDELTEQLTAFILMYTTSGDMEDGGLNSNKSSKRWNKHTLNVSGLYPTVNEQLCSTLKSCNK